MRKYNMQDPRTVDRLGYSLDPLEHSREVPEDSMDRLNELIDSREKIGRTQAYQRPVHDLDLFTANNSAQLGTLARSLANMSANVGTYKGVTPDTTKFNSIVKDFDAGNQKDLQNRMSLQKSGEDMLMQNIKLSTFAEEEKKKRDFRARPLDPNTRKLMESAYKEFGLTDATIRPDMTMGEFFDDPTNKAIYESISKKKAETSKEKAERIRAEKMESMADQPLSAEDYIVANQAMKSIDPNAPDLPKETTYGKMQESSFFGPVVERLKGPQMLSPYQQGMQIRAERKAKAEQDRKDKEDAKTRPQREELRKAQEVGKNITDALSEMESLVMQYGTSEPTNQTIDARMQSLSASALLQQKELENLGVLNAGDLPILRELIPPLGGLQGSVQINSRALSKIRSAQEMVKMKLKNKMAGLENSLGESAPATQQKTGKFPMTLKKDGQMVPIYNEQELKEAQAEGWK